MRWAHARFSRLLDPLPFRYCPRLYSSSSLLNLPVQLCHSYRYRSIFTFFSSPSGLFPILTVSFNFNQVIILVYSDFFFTKLHHIQKHVVERILSDGHLIWVPTLFLSLVASSRCLYLQEDVVCGPVHVAATRGPANWIRDESVSDVLTVCQVLPRMSEMLLPATPRRLLFLHDSRPANRATKRSARSVHLRGEESTFKNENSHQGRGAVM